MEEEDESVLSGSEQASKNENGQAENPTASIETVEMFESILSVLMQTLTELIKQNLSKSKKKCDLGEKDTKSTWVGSVRRLQHRAIERRNKLARRMAKERR